MYFFFFLSLNKIKRWQNLIKTQLKYWQALFKIKSTVKSWFIWNQIWNQNLKSESNLLDRTPQPFNLIWSNTIIKPLLQTFYEIISKATWILNTFDLIHKSAQPETPKDPTWLESKLKIICCQKITEISNNLNLQRCNLNWA